MSKLMIGAGVILVGVALAGAAWAWSVRGIETPKYIVKMGDGPFEVRAYPKLLLASIQKGGDRNTAVRQAFSPLASCIFAKERSGEKIAMTAPVTQSPGREQSTVSFIMPAEKNTGRLAPTVQGDHSPGDPPKVMAAYRFTGRWTDARFSEASDKLNAWMKSQGHVPRGEVEFAYYNDPFTPPFLRRNEVLVEVLQ